MYEKLTARLAACNEQGKKTPKTITLTLREIEQILRLQEEMRRRKDTGGSEFIDSRLAKLLSRLNEQISALESKEVKSTSVTVIGERHLDMDALLRRVNRYCKEVYNLSLLREEMHRRIKEAEDTLANIESNIPMSQAAEFRRLVNDLAQADTDFLPENE